MLPAGFRGPVARMEMRRLEAGEAGALLPLVRALAAEHGEAATATAETLARDLSDGWIWGFGAGVPLAGYALAIGHAEAQFGRRGAMLHHVYVTPPARRRGVARALVSAVEAEARARGCDYVVIGAHAGNDAARAAYAAMGYAWTVPTFWRFRKGL